MHPDAHQCPEVSNSSRLHTSRCCGNAFGCSSEFNKKLVFLLRHRYGKTAVSVRTLSLIRQDVEKNCNRSDVRATPFRRGAYYGIYVQQKCNRPDSRATLSKRGPNMVLCDARYGKPVARLSVRTTSACIQTPPREK
jgi:hypothetical protein